MGTVTWRRTKVTLDDGSAFEAEVMDGETWNGFACPRFSRTVADQIIASMNERGQAFVADGFDLGDVTLLHMEGALVIETDGFGDVHDTYQPDTDGKYAIGSHAWCWQEAQHDFVTAFRNDGDGARKVCAVCGLPMSASTHA